MHAEVEVVDDPAEAVAERLVAATGHIVLTGGSTPRKAYERAAELRHDWSGVSFWFSDERCVPPEDDQSNFRMVAERAAPQHHGRRGAPHGGGARPRRRGPALHRRAGRGVRLRAARPST